MQRIRLPANFRLPANYGALLAAISLLTANPAFAAEPTEATKQEERELIAILQSDRPAAEKAVPCKLLAVYGSADAVPALAPLLTDERWASWARTATQAFDPFFRPKTAAPASAWPQPAKSSKTTAAASRSNPNSAAAPNSLLNCPVRSDWRPPLANPDTGNPLHDSIRYSDRAATQ